MGDKTNISWTERTWNPYVGCKMISPGCANCYMFRDMRRYGQDPTIVRRTKPATFNAPYKWNREAQANGQRELVFTCSWSDWFIEAADAWRPDAWQVVHDTEWLIYQILTKRTYLVADRLPADWGEGYKNVGLGCSIESMAYAWRADDLRKVPAQVRFISAEPLLGSLKDLNLEGFDWLIAGGESGPDFREMNLDWARELRDKCVKAGVAFFYKQGSGLLPGKNNLLDGRTWEEYPEQWLRAA